MKHLTSLLPVLFAPLLLGFAGSVHAAERASPSGRFGLEIDGQFQFVQSFSGGRIQGEVAAANTVQGSTYPTKHLSSIRYEPVTLEVAPCQGAPSGSTGTSPS